MWKFLHMWNLLHMCKYSPSYVKTAPICESTWWHMCKYSSSIRENFFLHMWKRDIFCICENNKRSYVKTKFLRKKIVSIAVNYFKAFNQRLSPEGWYIKSLGLYGQIYMICTYIQTYNLLLTKFTSYQRTCIILFAVNSMYSCYDRY